MLGIVNSTMADNIVMISSASGQPGEEVEMTVSLQNTDDIIAAEIRIPLDRFVQYVEGSAMLNAERSNNHQLSVSGVDNEIKIYVYSLGNTPLKGNSGTLATFRLKLGRNPECLSLIPEVVISNVSGQSISNRVEAGHVTILAPQLTIESPTIDYGHIPIRSTYTRNLTLRNSGTATLHVSDITFSAAELSTIDKEFDLAAGASLDVMVTYAPTKHGAISEKATVISDATNEKQIATIVADPYSVNELHIGSVTGNSDTEVTVDVTMNNMEPIVAAQWTFELPDALKYVDGSISIGKHAEGLSAYATVASKKLTIFLYSQNNTEITEGDGKIASFRLCLQGQSGTYSLSPTNVVLGNASLQNMVSAVCSGNISIKSPSIIVNSKLEIPDNPVTETVTQSIGISNYGQTDLTINKVTFLQEGFSIVEELPITITPWADKKLTIKYVPPKAGNYATTMQIYSNDPVTHMASVALSGMIFEPNSVSISSEACSNNVDYNLSISMQNYSSIVAAQMDINSSEAFSVANDEIEKTARLNGVNATIAKINDNKWRLILFSLNNESISGHEGEILSFNIHPEDVDLCGATVSIDNVFLSTMSGENLDSSNNISTRLLGPDCEETVFLPDKVFEFNYNFRNYDINGHKVSNHVDATLADYNLQLFGNYPSWDTDHITIDRIAKGYIDKWSNSTNASGSYFYRSGNNNMTMVAKVAPTLNRRNAGDFISNRGNGYNYMFRVAGDNNSFYLHTGTAYSSSRSMVISSSEPQVLAVRVNGSENYIQLDNVTTGETKKISGVNWGDSNNIFKFFYNDDSEYYCGDVYWMYYSFECLTDDDIVQVVEYNDYVPIKTILGDVNKDGDVTISDVVATLSIMNGGSTANLNLKAADVNRDNDITISDVVGILSIMNSK